MLEVDIGEVQTQKLLTDLKAVKHLTVEESKRDKGMLFVTVVMPYSKYSGGETANFGKTPISKELFGKELSDFAPKSATPATARDLPSYGDLSEIVKKHDGKLKGISWKCWACRVLGGVGVPDVSARPERSPN